jgi:periplasmic protein TonB
METKKNPAKDVHRQSFKFFLVGLAISVSSMITAFEWTSEKRMYVPEPTEPPSENIISVMATVHELPKPEPFLVKKIQPVVSVLVPTSEPASMEETKPAIDFTGDDFTLPSIDSTLFNLPNEDDEKIHILAEVQPKPVGGYEQFYSTLSKNLRYPRQAIRQFVDGKVYVEFVVDKKGKVVQPKILKGIGSGCDEEAMRVVALTQWEPGRQRGQPVNVRMVMPVAFKIH